MVVSKFALIKQLNVLARLFKAYAASQQHKIAFCRNRARGCHATRYKSEQVICLITAIFRDAQGKWAAFSLRDLGSWPIEPQRWASEKISLLAYYATLL